MGIIYNKEHTPKDRLITGKSVRDRQLQQSKSRGSEIDSNLIESLYNQINSLQEQLSVARSSSGWNDEKVNLEIEKALKSELKVVRSGYETEISVLKERSKNLEETLKTFKESRQRDSEIMNKLRDENTTLKSENSSLKEKIKNKEDVIQQLKDNQTKELVIPEERLANMIAEATRNIALNSGVIQQTADKDRPQIEAVFVDPIETQTNTESYIKVEDISVEEKEYLQSKVQKLKGLMGKLPDKRG